MQTKALLLEDDEFTRISLEAALHSAGLKVVVSTGKPGDAIARAEETKPNIAILDLHLGGGPTGIDVARILRRDNPSIGILLLTSYSDPRFLSTKLPDPPSGTRYVVKKDVRSIDHLLNEISLALQKQPKSPTVNQSLEKLTDSQVETLKLVAEGLSNREIAKRRFVQEKSIEAIIARAAKSLNITIDKSTNQRVNIAKVYFEATGMSGHFDE